MTAAPSARATLVVAGAAVLLVLVGGSLWLLLPAGATAWQAPLGLAIAVPAVAAIGRGLIRGPERLAWACVAAGLALTGAAGELGLPGGHAVPPPAVAIADVLWWIRAPLLYGGLALLVARRIGRVGAAQLVDGLVGAFAAAALLSVLVMPWVVEGARADDATVALRSLYPLVDVLVIGFLAGAAALNGWPKRVYVPLVVDMLLFLGCQLIDLRASFTAPGAALGWATYPGFLLAGWSLALAALALQAAPRRIVVARRPFLPSLVLAAGAVATLVAVALMPEPGLLATALAGASLVAALGRQALTLRDHDRLLARAEREASTDALTGLKNRRLLAADLDAAVARARPDAPVTLALFDLDGFKHYNDTFGHPAGDALLERLAGALGSAVAPHGAAYRMGGDEFCVLFDGDDPDPVEAARAALTSRGEGFLVGASGGVALVPRDATRATDALRLADQRMYAEKGTGRRTAPELRATAALLQVVRERDPALSDHVDEVSEWATAVARRLGACDEVVEQARLGGELHDIGKTSIPDAILDKPGPLTDAEWEFMRRHTVIGERILLADPALALVAPVARSHHERWAGGGYPDGLRGDAIPLAARIVSVCDAYEAMVADRPYRLGRPAAEALAELRRCSGEQFDPAVVDAFVAEIGGEVAHAA